MMTACLQLMTNESGFALFCSMEGWEAVDSVHQAHYLNIALRHIIENHIRNVDIRQRSDMMKVLDQNLMLTKHSALVHS